jgi:hypothetical protein
MRHAMWRVGVANGATAFPPPLWGRDRERGKQQAQLLFSYQRFNRCSKCCGPLFPSLFIAKASRSVFVTTPLPVPPPQGGREPWGPHLRNSRSAFADRLQRCVHALALAQGRQRKSVLRLCCPLQIRECRAQQARVVRTEAQRAVAIAAKQSTHAARNVAVIDA